MDTQEMQGMMDWGTKAREAYEAHRKALADQQEAICAQNRLESQWQLLDALETVLGVTEGYTLETREDQAIAMLEGIPDLIFSAASYDSVGGILYAQPLLHLMVPERPEYENWQKNPKNRGLEDHRMLGRRYCINSWADVGYLVTEHDNFTVTPEPWRLEAPKHFAWLTEAQLNEETRPFRLTGMATQWEGEPVALVEYIEGLEECVYLADQAYIRVEE